jgi:hypothetical protein
VFRDGRFVAESEPIHLDDMEVHYDGEPVCRFAATSALSDDPLIGFTLRAGAGGVVRVVLRNSRGQVFEAAQAIRVS